MSYSELIHSVLCTMLLHMYYSLAESVEKLLINFLKIIQTPCCEWSRQVFSLECTNAFNIIIYLFLVNSDHHATPSESDISCTQPVPRLGKGAT